MIAEQRVTRIVHMAASPGPIRGGPSPVLGATVNVVGTTAVFEAARRNGDQVRGIAYASSGSVYSSRRRQPFEAAQTRYAYPSALAIRGVQAGQRGHCADLLGR